MNKPEVFRPADVVPAWLHPTVRAINWTPLALITAALSATVVTLGWRHIEVPSLITHLGVAGLAAAAVLGLDDPARPLLQALPTRPIAQLAHRAVLLVAATALAAAGCVVVAIAVTGDRFVDSRSTDPELAAALMALAASGTAVRAILGTRLEQAEEAAAGSILLWVGGAVVVPDAWVPEPLRLAWLDHPLLVTAVAVLVVIVATCRRGA